MSFSFPYTKATVRITPATFTCNSSKSVLYQRVPLGISGTSVVMLAVVCCGTVQPLSLKAPCSAAFKFSLYRFISGVKYPFSSTNFVVQKPGTIMLVPQCNHYLQ